VAFGLGGLVVAALVRALGAWAESRSRADRGAYLPAELLLRAISSPPPAPDIPSPLVPAGAAQERTGEEDRVATSATRLAEVRRLIREGAWDEAREGVRAFRSASPDDPRGAEVSEELEGAKRAALERLEAELKAARGVNDPEQVMEIHSRMQVLVDGGTGDDLDVELAGWLLLVVHRRLRGGRIQPDVVSLAERVAERFGHTKEGASLRASLPTLRRSAGLCPRCGKPFTGAAEACPECLGASPPPASLVASEEDDEFAVERREPDWYSEPSDETAA
jgi:hypothetical protein